MRNAIDAWILGLGCPLLAGRAVPEAHSGLDYDEVFNADHHWNINRSVDLRIKWERHLAAAEVAFLADMPLVTGGMIASVVERYNQSGLLVMEDF